MFIILGRIKTRKSLNFNSKKFQIDRKSIIPLFIRLKMDWIRNDPAKKKINSSRVFSTEFQNRVSPLYSDWLYRYVQRFHPGVPNFNIFAVAQVPNRSNHRYFSSYLNISLSLAIFVSFCSSFPPSPYLSLSFPLSLFFSIYKVSLLKVNGAILNTA